MDIKIASSIEPMSFASNSNSNSKIVLNLMFQPQTLPRIPFKPYRDGRHM